MSHPNKNTLNRTNSKSVVSLPIEDGFISLRSLSPKKLRFEIEYSLGKGTTSNSFLLSNHNTSHYILINPPGANFEEVFLPIFRKHIPDKDSQLTIVIGHVNPNRINLLRSLRAEFNDITIICSNPGGKLLNELWQQRKPTETGNNIKSAQIPLLPKIHLIKQEETLDLFNGYKLKLIPAPTARWPGGLITFEEKTGLLMSDKLFAAHICTAKWAENNRVSTDDERRHYFDCLMTPMLNQINRIIEKLELLEIKSVAPGHGPVIETSWRSLLNDYQRWGEQQKQSSIKIILLFASAYGNTASIADTLSKGISSTGVQVESFNCEFISANELVLAIKNADGYLIGSPTLGGHAPTPIVEALGTLLAEGDRKKPVGIFGSFGWSGEALDLLENKLRDGGFEFAFDPIKIKFSPNAETLKRLEETGTTFGRQLIQEKRRQERRISGGINAAKSDPALLALGKIIGTLSVLIAQKEEEGEIINGAMVASWISQASFSPPGITIAVAKDRAVENMLHNEDLFSLNILNENNYQKTLRQFLQPFSPGQNRLSGLELLESPGRQPILPEAIAWIEGCVQQRMECGDHWLIYAKIVYGKVLDPNGVTAVHHRRTGANY